MIDFNGLNYLAIFVAWVINIGLGSFWYSPAGFEKQWSKLSGVNMMKIPKDEANKAISFVAVSALLQTIVLAVVINSLDVTTAVNGFIAGLVLWFGLTALTTVGNNLYMRKSWKFWWLNASFFLIVMTVNSVIFAVWQ